MADLDDNEVYDQPDTQGLERINVVYNNPGALGLSALGEKYGATASGKFDTGHPFAAFPTPEAGAAAQFALWQNKEHYLGHTLKDAITNWIGPGEHGEAEYISAKTGIPLDHVITDDFLRSPQGIRLMQAQAHYEGANALTPEQWKRGQAWAYEGIPSTGVSGMVRGSTFGPESGSGQAAPQFAKYDILSKDFMQDEIHNNFPEYNDQDPEQTWQAFDKKNDTPLKKIQALFPEYADMEPHLLAENLRRKYYPDVTSDEFWERLNPPTGMFAGVQSELYNAAKGFHDQARATLHASSAKAYESVGAGQEFGKYIADQIGATPYIEGIQQFLGHPEGYFRQAVKFLDEQGKKQEAAAAHFQGLAQQSKGVSGYIGRAAGGVAGQIPEMMSTAAIPGGSLATRIGIATGYEAISGFGRKIQEGQEQAFTEAAKDGFMGATNALIINSPLGRLKSGMTFALLNTGQNELENWINGNPSSVQDDALHASVDFGLGMLMGKAHERGLAPVKEAPGEAPGALVPNIIPKPKGPHTLYGDPDEPGWQGGVPAPVMEELNHAIDARDQGDYKTAAEHIDRSMALLSKEDQADVTQRVVDHINPKPEEKKPPSDEAVKTFVNHFYGLGNRGEMGSVINPFHRRKGEQSGMALNPAQILHDFFRDNMPKREKREGYSQWEAEFHGERVNPVAAAIVKRRTSEAQMIKHAMPRNIAMISGLGERIDIRPNIERWLHIDDRLRGATVVARRKAAFNKKTRAELKQILLNHDDNVSSGDRELDEILKFHSVVYDAMEQAEKEARAKYEPRDSYMFQAVKRANSVDPVKQEAETRRFENWLNKQSASSPDPRFTHQRKLPKWRDVFRAGFEPESYNPEDLLQMRLNQHANFMRKVRSMDDLVREDLAIPAGKASKDIQEVWRDSKSIDGQTRLPNGEKYYVEPSARKVLEIAWDQFNLAYVPIVGPFYQALMIGKGFSAGLKLGWSAMHIKHIATKMAPASQLVRIQKLLLSKDRGNPSAWKEAMSKFFNFGFTGVPEVDFWQGRRPMSEATPEQLRNILHIQQMGLDLHASPEREMQFAQNIAQWFPKPFESLEKPAKVADQILHVGYKIASAEPFMKWQFGTVIPRLKFLGAMAARDSLLRDHPELIKPENRMKLQVALSETGRSIEARFGEMNMDNLLWRSVYKQIGTSTMLSMGWNVGAIRIYADSVKDLTSNAAHMHELLGKITRSSKTDHVFLTDRMLFAVNYTVATMIEAGLMTYFMGHAIPSGIDFVYPLVGKDQQGKDKRVSPIEFTREITSVWHHLAQEGPFEGGWSVIRSKMQPFLSTVIQDMENKNFYGVRISDPLDSWQQQAFDRLAYLLEALTPITWSQQGMGRPMDLFDRIMSIAGAPPAPTWTSRSDIENEIIATKRREQPYEMTPRDVTRMDAVNRYKDALHGKDAKAIEAARDDALKAGVTEKSLEKTEDNLDETPGQKDLSRLKPESQFKIWNRMTDEQKKMYYEYLRPSVRDEVDAMRKYSPRN